MPADCVDAPEVPDAIATLIDRLDGDPDNASAKSLTNWQTFCHAMAKRHGFCQVWLNRFEPDNCLQPITGTGVLQVDGCTTPCSEDLNSDETPNPYAIVRDFGEHGVYRLWRYARPKCSARDSTAVGATFTCKWLLPNGKSFALTFHGPEKFRHPEPSLVLELTATSRYLKLCFETRTRLRLETLQKTLNRSPSPVFLADHEQRIFWVNRALQRMHAADERSVVGQRIGGEGEIIRLKMSDAPCALLQTSVSLESGQEVLTSGEASARVWIVKSLAPLLDASGLAEAYLGMLCDAGTDEASAHPAKESYQTDDLTGLMSRTYFLEQLRQRLSLPTSDKQGCALLFLDLDRFKHVNDRHGHVTGDRLLAAVGERLRQCLRGIDLVARYGGDEFVVLATEIADDTAVRLIAKRILASFSSPFEVDGRQLSVGISIGIAHYPRDADSDEALIRCADTAMYAAKNTGCGYLQYAVLGAKYECLI